MDIEESQPQAEKRKRSCFRLNPFQLRGLFLFRCFQNSGQTNPSGNRERLNSKADRQKVLLIGKTGRGKASVGKKLAYDWATRTFSIAFLLLLKAVKPGDSIEATILHQIPDLNGQQCLRTYWKHTAIDVC